MSAYRETEGGVVRLADGAFVPADPENRDFREFLAWIEAGNSPVAPQPTIEGIASAFEARVQVYLDQRAQALGYDDIRTAVTYADEPAVPKFQDEGQSLRRLRSLVWARCYQLLVEVQAGVRGVPTEAELMADLESLE